MPLIPVTTEWLSSLDALKEVPADQLQWMIDNSRHYELAAGEYSIKPGEVINGTHVIVKGRMLMYTVQEGIRKEFFSAVKGEVTGYLPYSRANVAGMFAESVEDM